MQRPTAATTLKFLPLPAKIKLDYDGRIIIK
jgi:hypothetical protein